MGRISELPGTCTSRMQAGASANASHRGSFFPFPKSDAFMGKVSLLKADKAVRRDTLRSTRQQTLPVKALLSCSLGEFDAGGSSGGQNISSALPCTGYRANPCLEATAIPLKQEQSSSTCSGFLWLPKHGCYWRKKKYSL